MQFLNPYWLYALLLVPLFIIGAVLARRHRSRAWKRLIAPRLRQNLVNQSSQQLHWISFALCLLSFALCIVALARPYWGEVSTQEKVSSRNIMIAVDTSKSMLCHDLSTDRLTAAKALAIQMLEKLPNDHIGALAFAGESNVIAPLTIDHYAVHETIAQLDTASVPIDGSDLYSAVATGLETLKATGKRSSALIILSDGEEHDTQLEETLKLAREAQVQIFTVGVGSHSGGIIPSAKFTDGKHRDWQGNVVHTKLEDSTLKKLAEVTNGLYTPINKQAEVSITKALDSMEKFEQEGRKQVIPLELYSWFLAPAVLLAICAALLRAKWPRQSKAIASVPLLLALLALSPQQVKADSWFDSVKQRFIDRPEAEQSGYKALSEKRYKDAVPLLSKARDAANGDARARIALALGQAHYRLEEIEASTAAFTQALLSSDPQIQAQAQHNLGNSLFQQQWNSLEGLGSTPLKQYLMEGALKTRPATITEKKLDTLEQGFQNALEKFQHSHRKTNNASTADNINQTESALQAIEDVRLAIKQEKQRQQKQRQQDDKQQGDKQQGDKQQGDKQQGDKQQGDKQQGDKQQGDKQQGDKQQGDKPAQGSSSQSPWQRENYTPTEQEAREFLQKRADMQQRPYGSGRKVWRKRSNNDW